MVGVPEQVVVAVAAQRDRLVTPGRPKRPLAAARRHQLRETYKNQVKSESEKIVWVFAGTRNNGKIKTVA